MNAKSWSASAACEETHVSHRGLDPQGKGASTRASARRIATYPLLYFDVRMGREALETLEDVADDALDTGQIVIVPALGELSCPGPEDLQCRLHVHGDDVRRERVDARLE